MGVKHQLDNIVLAWRNTG